MSTLTGPHVVASERALASSRWTRTHEGLLGSLRHAIGAWNSFSAERKGLLRARRRGMDASSTSTSARSRVVRARRQSRALAARTNAWLLKHGRPTVPRNLSAKERREVDDCFELLDEDDSGTLDPDELLKAFQMLGVSASKSHVIRLMQQIDADGNGEIDQQEFRALMAQQIGQSASEVVASDAAGAKEDVQDRALPLQTMLLAFRRRKTLQDFLRGGEARARLRIAMAVEVDVCSSVNSFA